MLLTSFRNGRARLQRLTDARFFAGWARDLTPETLTIQLVDEHVPKPGDPFHIEIRGDMVSALFRAKVVLVHGQYAYLHLLEAPRFIASTEDMRIRAGEYKALARDRGYEFAITILDVSLRGIGVLMTETRQAGDKLEIEYDSPHGPVQGVAEVRYCQPSAKDFGAYRAGLLWTHMDRLSAARWHKVVDEAKLAA